GYSLAPPGIAGYRSPQPDYATWPMEKRIAEARRLYAAAGYSGDKPLEVEIRYNTGDTHHHVALAIANMWKRHLGVKTRLVHEEWRVVPPDQDGRGAAE